MKQAKIYMATLEVIGNIEEDCNIFTIYETSKKLLSSKVCGYVEEIFEEELSAFEFSNSLDFIEEDELGNSDRKLQRYRHYLEEECSGRSFKISMVDEIEMEIDNDGNIRSINGEECEYDPDADLH